MFVCTLFEELRSQGTTDSFLAPPKNPYSNQATQKILAKFLYPKKSLNWKFQTQKNPSIIPVTWHTEYPPGTLTDQHSTDTPQTLHWLSTDILAMYQMTLARYQDDTWPKYEPSGGWYITELMGSTGTTVSWPPTVNMIWWFCYFCCYRDGNFFQWPMTFDNTINYHNSLMYKHASLWTLISNYYFVVSHCKTQLTEISFCVQKLHFASNGPNSSFAWLLPCTSFKLDMYGANLHHTILGTDFSLILLQITFKNKSIHVYIKQISTILIGEELRWLINTNHPHRRPFLVTNLWLTGHMILNQRCEAFKQEKSLNYYHLAICY